MYIYILRIRMLRYSCAAIHLRVLRFGDVHKRLCCRMDDVEKLHDGSTVIGNRDRPLVIVDELVHPPWPEGGPYDIDDSQTGIDVTDQLGLALGGIRPLLQQNNLRLLHHMAGMRESESAQAVVRAYRSISASVRQDVHLQTSTCEHVYILEADSYQHGGHRC